MQDNFIESYSLLDEDFCKKAIACFEEADKHNLCRTRQEANVFSKNLMDDSAVHLPLFEYPLGHASSTVTQTAQDAITSAINEYYAKYSACQELGSVFNFSAKIQKTKAGQGYHVWHSEASNREVSQRQFAWTIYLNDDFEAGETEFLYQQYRYKPKMGDVLIFPAGFTHTHRGNPPINGTKYIITGWLEF